MFLFVRNQRIRSRGSSIEPFASDFQKVPYWNKIKLETILQKKRIEIFLPLRPDSEGFSVNIPVSQKSPIDVLFTYDNSICWYSVGSLRLNDLIYMLIGFRHRFLALIGSFRNCQSIKPHIRQLERKSTIHNSN